MVQLTSSMQRHVLRKREVDPGFVVGFGTYRFLSQTLDL